MLASPAESLDQMLSPSALRNGEHGGRLHAEDESPYRTYFQRDRDRIIHSKAFRRLGYKTQVFVNSEGDNYRARLTHSLEVSQIARSVSAALGLNGDYAETLALAHDLGHTPFGHAGQDALHELMKEQGGFEHNRQSLRIVSSLENRYPDFRGLNLTRATLKGMMKHARIYDCDSELEPLLRERQEGNPVLEASLTDLCDRIAYIHHDLEDGLDARILSFDELFTVRAWEEAHRELENGETFRGARLQIRIRSVIRHLMNRCIGDVIETLRSNLRRVESMSRDDILRLERDKYPIRLSNTMREILGDFQKLLFARLYRDPRVMQMSRRGRNIITYLFQEYTAQPEMMPRHYQDRIASEGLPRVVADYISGMTDRFALKEYRYLTGRDE